MLVALVQRITGTKRPEAWHRLWMDDPLPGLRDADDPLLAYGWRNDHLDFRPFPGEFVHHVVDFPCVRPSLSR